MPRSRRQEPAVYGLRASGVFGYVGGTLTTAKDRLWEHRSRARHGHQAPVYVWMREVGIENVEAVVLEAMPTVDVVRLLAAEAAWIASMLRDGEPLQNDIGRDGTPHTHSERSRLAISRAKRSGEPPKTRVGGWTDERRAAQRDRIRALNEQRWGSGSK